MAETFQFGPVLAVVAEAIGQPGQRRFRINALSPGGESAAIWLEKEQLAALGDALETVLREEEFEYEPLPLDDVPEAPAFPLNATVDFRAAQLSMGVNRDTRHIVLVAADGEDDGLSVAFEFPYRRGFELRREIAETVAAGRPPCPLCGAPLDPSGHVCPRSNGHHPQ
ncbi:MAG: DUF3090 domain-containing protein [Dehalococcoidia bacterium]|nr:DUF3090 domain-containing protein [Dehalococcoidia bacterium]